MSLSFMDDALKARRINRPVTRI